MIIIIIISQSLLNPSTDQMSYGMKGKHQHTPFHSRWQAHLEIPHSCTHAHTDTHTHTRTCAQLGTYSMWLMTEAVWSCVGVMYHHDTRWMMHHPGLLQCHVWALFNHTHVCTVHTHAHARARTLTHTAELLFLWGRQHHRAVILNAIVTVCLVFGPKVADLQAHREL